MARRRVWLALPIGAMLLLAAIALLEWREWPFLRGPLERALSDATGRHVDLGPDFGVRLIGSIRLRGEHIEIGQPPPQAQQPTDETPFLVASRLRIKLPYSTVWRMLRGPADAPLRVSLLEVDELSASLVRDAEGRANWSFADPEATEPSAPVPLPEFDRLLVRSGEIRLRDALTELEIDAHVRTREGSVAAASDGGNDAGDGAGLEIMAEGKYRDSPLQATLRSTGILPLAASGSNVSPVPVQLELRSGDTVLDLDGQVTDLLNLRALSADYRLRGPSLAAAGEPLGLTLPASNALEISGAITKEQERWSTKVEALEVGSSRLQGEFAYDASLDVPKLSGTLRGERLALRDLGPALGTGGGSDEKAARKRKGVPVGRVLPQREFDIMSLAAMDADLRLDLDSVDLGSALTSMAPLQAQLTLDDSVLAIAELVAHTASGELRGLLRLDASNEAEPRWHADLRVARVRLEQFLTARSDGDLPYLSGILGGRAKLDGRGSSTAEMLASLDGNADFWIRNGKISQLLLEVSGIDIAQSLGLLVGDDRQLAMQCAAARLKIEDGLATPEVAVIDTVDTTLLVTGELSLAEERLALVLTARPKDVSPLALRSPLLVEGTFREPKVRPELGTTALRLGAAALLAAIAAPAAALLALIDLGEADKAVCAESLQRLRDPRSPSAGERGDSQPGDGESGVPRNETGGRGKKGNSEGGGRPPDSGG